ncbi:GAF domain-containing protein [Actinoplanes sp. NPDC020271]|uniref:GAF domain-containing protein n=1 Tax=Actinoplanes sp. NPDC020271 TaxID=3363896 RepID=UPI0037A0FBDD
MNSTTNTDLFDRLGEPARMRHLAAYDLLHPELRDHLDRIATHSAHKLNAPVSMASILLDSAQLIIGRHGLPDTGDDLQGTPAEWALCTHTVLAGAPFLLTDNTADPRHADNPLLNMTGLRSYAGVPLTDDSGHVLGAHCVLDATPRHFTEEDLDVLTQGAAEIMRILDRHRLA